jgi:4'-phosphopantetheinyl transferase EntD
VTPSAGRWWDAALPDGAAACSVPVDAPGLRALPPAEREAVASAGPRRVQKFTAGRHCAAVALVALGCPDTPVRRGPGGQPAWPAGIVGSITHDDERALAVVCRAGEVRGLGVDIERVRPLRPALARRLCTEAELRAAARVVEEPLLTIFSAKESVYKAWYSLVGGSLGFFDVEIGFDPGGDRFRVAFRDQVRAVEALSFGSWRGRMAGGDGRICTSVAVVAG